MAPRFGARVFVACLTPFPVSANTTCQDIVTVINTDRMKVTTVIYTD